MEKKEFHAKVMFYMMCKSLEEIAKVDEDFQDEIEEFEAKIQWNIVDFKGALVFDKGKYSFEMDYEIEDPDVIFTINDVDTALEMFSGKIDGPSAYMSGDLQIEGNLQDAMMYGSLSDYIAEYLDPIRQTE